MKALKTIASLVCLGLVAATQTQAQTPALSAATGAEKDRIAGLVADAAREGKLTYWDTVMQPATKNALQASFVEFYGLPKGFQIEFSEIAPSNMITRLEQEAKAGRATVDVAAVASPIWVAAQARAGALMKYNSPEYANYSMVADAGLVEPGSYAFNGAYVFVPLWDPEKLKVAGDSWNDAIAAAQEGRVSVGNGAASDATIMTYIGLRTAMGKDYVAKLAAKKPVFIPKSETIASRVVTGEDTMAFMGMPTRAYQLNQKGAKLSYLLPKEGVTLLPQNFFILANATHPAAAKLWFDFILSEKGQKIIVEKEAMISGRNHFVSPIPDYAPQIDKLHLVHIDWNKMTPEDLQAARREWMDLFKQ
jgi:iron(III) transport system substrate-binding protein